MSDAADDEFATLRPSLRRAIDTAFLKLSRRAKSNQPPRKKPRLEDPGSDEEGGFVKDDQDEQEESDEEQESIPLSMIPTGLQMLDLPPDDKDVLSVFRNAATGWESRPGVSRRRESESDDETTIDKDAGLSVSQEDWRAVCAVLLSQKEDQDETEDARDMPKKRREKTTNKAELEAKEQEQPDRRVTRGRARAAAKQIEAEDSGEEGGGFLVKEEGGGFISGSNESGGFLPPSDEEIEDAQDGSDSDRYSDNDDASSVSEFGVPIQPKSTRSNYKARRSDVDMEMDVDDNWENDIPRSLTVRQLGEARLTFALFFPGVDANDPSLNTRRLGVKEVQEAAKTLKENLSSDDIIEMISMFSSAPDGSIGLEEFGRMAVMARLI